MSFASSDCFTSSFSVWFPFFAFSYPIALTWTSKIPFLRKGCSLLPLKRKKIERVGILFLFLMLREVLSNFSPLSMMLAMSLSYMAFIMLRYVPSMPTFWSVFMINGCWILSKVFPSSIKMTIYFFLQFTDVVCHTDWFVVFEKYLYPWDKSHLIMVYDPFDVMLDLDC